MKKYRYDDPGKITPRKRYLAYAVLFIGWNFIGYGIFKYFSKDSAKKDPEWENRPDDKKIAIIGGGDPKSVKRFSLFGSSEKEKNEV